MMMKFSPPHPEEPAEAFAKAGVSQDGAARAFASWFETRAESAFSRLHVLCARSSP
jgi:hypothetical protein